MKKWLKVLTPRPLGCIHSTQPSPGGMHKPISAPGKPPFAWWCVVCVHRSSAWFSIVQHGSAWLSMVQHNTACSCTGLSMKCTAPMPPQRGLARPLAHHERMAHATTPPKLLCVAAHGLASAKFSTTPFGHAWVWRYMGLRAERTAPMPPRRGLMHPPAHPGSLAFPH